MRSSSRIWFLRHAESTWNAARLWQGQADPPLSPTGRAQARAVGERLRGVGFAALVTSDLRRATETARLVGGVIGLAPRLEPRLRERGLGAWEGLRSEEIAARWPADLERLQTGDPELRPGGGETLAEVGARLGELLQELVREEAAQGPVLLVTHLGVISIAVPGAAPEPAEFVVAEVDACLTALSGAARAVAGVGSL